MTMASNDLPSVLEKITAVINEQFADQLIHAEILADFPTFELKSDRIIDVIRYLYNHPEARLQFLTTMCCVHYPDNKKIAVVYQLHNLVSNVRIRLKIFLPEEKPSVQTLTPVFPVANWMEREAYDFYGVEFQGHPNLIRILNVEEMIIFPLRKEYPLEDQVRRDKNDAMFGR